MKLGINKSIINAAKKNAGNKLMYIGFMIGGKGTEDILIIFTTDPVKNTFTKRTQYQTMFSKYLK